jgi:hypothetical protein
MALAEARVKAQSEFESVLKKARRPLSEIRSFVAKHPELRSPMYQVTRRPGVVSTAANFLLDVDALIDRAGGTGSLSCPEAMRGALEGQTSTVS